MATPAAMEAIERARRIAEKLTGVPVATATAGATTLPETTKRSFESAFGIGDNQNGNSGGGPSAAVAEAQRRAMEAAAKLTKMDPSGGGGGGGGQPTKDNCDEVFMIPERAVGLLIGKGGETIQGLQAECGGRAQVDPNKTGGPERSVFLRGSPQQLRALKQKIVEITSKGRDNMGGGASYMIEIPVPGNKVGIIIGKGGEMIKKLQSDFNVKMMMLQESNDPTVAEKPLKISGDRAQVQQAQNAVMELINQVGNQRGPPRGNQYDNPGAPPGFGILPDATPNRPGMYMPPGYEGPALHHNLPPPTPMTPYRIEIPNEIVGAVIGKNGEVIKRVMGEFGIKLQFYSEHNHQTGLKVCEFSGGSPSNILRAADQILNIVDTLMGSGDSGNPAPDQNNPSYREVKFTVPSMKAGYIIGKSGCVIKDLQRDSGAHIELVRDQGGFEVEDKTFKVRGDMYAVDRAVAMMAQRSGVPPPSGWGQGCPPGVDQLLQNCGYPGVTGNLPSQVMPGNNGAGPQGGGWGGQPGGFPQQQQAQQQPGWGGNQQGGWNGQPQQPMGQPTSQQPSSQAPSGGGQNATATSGTGATGGGPGQPDYTEQWAEYYRSMGYSDYADALLAEKRGGGAAGNPPASAAGGAAASSAGGMVQQQTPAAQAAAMMGNAQMAGAPMMQQQPRMPTAAPHAPHSQPQQQQMPMGGPGGFDYAQFMAQQQQQRS